MDKQLQNHLDKIVQALNSGIDILSNQAPKVIRETLTYYTWQSIILALVFLFLTVISVWGFFWLKKKNDNGSCLDDWGLGMALSLIPVFSFMLGTVLEILDIIKIMVAPRLFLIEKITHLI